MPSFAQVVAALRETGLPFGHFDILSDDDVRQGIKVYSNWPTFPQVGPLKTYVAETSVSCEMFTVLRRGRVGLCKRGRGFWTSGGLFGRCGGTI